MQKVAPRPLTPPRGRCIVVSWRVTAEHRRDAMTNRTKRTDNNGICRSGDNGKDGE